MRYTGGIIDRTAKHFDSILDGHRRLSGYDRLIMSTRGNSMYTSSASASVLMHPPMNNSHLKFIVYMWTTAK